MYKTKIQKLWRQINIMTKMKILRQNWIKECMCIAWKKWNELMNE